MGGVREQAPAAGHLAQLEAAVGVGVLGREVGEGRGGLAGGDAKGLGELRGGHGVGRDEQKRLEGRLERVRVKVFEVKH